MIFVLALAGSLAAQRAGVVTIGTLRTHSPVFIGLLISTTLVVVGLEYSLRSPSVRWRKECTDDDHLACADLYDAVPSTWAQQHSRPIRKAWP
jgi:K+-transporting ATPase, A chain